MKNSIIKIFSIAISVLIIAMGYHYIINRPFTENSLLKELGIEKNELSSKAITSKFTNKKADGNTAIYYGEGFDVVCSGAAWNYIDITDTSYKFGNVIRNFYVGMDIEHVKKLFKGYKTIKDLPEYELGYIINNMFWVEFIHDDDVVNKIRFRAGP